MPVLSNCGYKSAVNPVASLIFTFYSPHDFNLHNCVRNQKIRLENDAILCKLSISL